MKSGIRIAMQALIAIAIFAAGSQSAYATFPGKNGRIAFIQGPDVYTMNSDGSDVKQLTNLGPDSGAAWESWSPDGKQIVFNEYRPPDFLGQLWLMNADGTNQHLLFAESDLDDERPSFTPDGSSVVFSRCQLDGETCTLYRIKTEGSGLTPITKFDFGIQDLSAVYSPVGEKLGFTSVARGGIICAIYVTTAQVSKLHQVTPPLISARQPDWAPDGTKIVFSTHCGNPENEEIWVVDAKGSGLRRLTKNGNDYFNGLHDYHPSWSPQGDAIVFERDAPDFSSFGIFIMKADGSHPTQARSLSGKPAHSNFGSHWMAPRGAGRASPNRRQKQIEEGGALPRWGVAPN
jgi:Tol biopolymer transport system component